MKMFPRVLSIVALAALICATTPAVRAQSPAAAPANPPATEPKAGDLPVVADQTKAKAAKGITATKDQPFVNSLGMKFVPVEITVGPTSWQNVLFSVWETRVGDFAAFVEASKGSYRYKDGGTPYGWDGGKWKQKSGASWKNPGFSQTDAHPVTCVSWEDAGKFCAWLTEKERASGKIGQQDTYRLPTDHEWSCAVGIGDREDASKTPKEKDMKIADVYPWNGGKGTWPPPKGAGNYSGQETKGKFVKMIDGYDDGYVTTAPVESFEANVNGQVRTGAKRR